MDIFLTIVFALAVMALLLAYLMKQKKKPLLAVPISEENQETLASQVPFYQKLPADKKKEFEQRVQHFLATVKITGINTIAEETDRVLIAASAVIPIFNFPGWEYINLNEVLLYPDSFNHEFEQQGGERPILGMVGTGAMNGVMILSQHELRQAFINKTGKTNTAIHEFVHLVDKTDGSIDGLPGFIADKRYIKPWLSLMRSEIHKITANQSDINPYGATNEAEFFAVASEYFFERPDLFKQKHPDLFNLLSTIFGKEEINNSPAK